jgi:DNA-binding NarL/FixJ family response regulator
MPSLRHDVSSMLEPSEPLKQDRTRKTPDLTPRELEVLQLLSSGATNAQISGRLRISLKTTKNHLVAIYQKLGVSNRTQALSKAVSTGLVHIQDYSRID